jgi:hypothetical protein
VAIADPEATVNGRARAGVVHVVYGGGKGEVSLDEDLSWVPGTAETGDRFGFSLATYDANLDGCGDLAVGAPYESIGTVPNAGMVHVLYGSPTGLGGSAAGYEQNQPLFNALAEQDDWFGYALAAGNSPSGQPFLAIGVPGEALGAVEDAGMVDYLYGTSPKMASLGQDDPGVGGTVEENDRFGASLAADSSHLVIGDPGEAIGAEAFAGGVQVVSTTINADGIPTPLAGISEVEMNVPPQRGDGFGTSVALVPYRDAAAPDGPATGSLLAIGIPGGQVAGNAGAGAVAVFRVSAAGVVSYDHAISQGEAGVQGTAEPGDRFGQRVAGVNLTPGAVGSNAAMLLAVGVPGEDTDAGVDAGGVEVFSLSGAPGSTDVWVAPGERGVPGSAGPRDYTGMSVSSGGPQLYVGVPYGDSADRAVLGIPWTGVDGTVSPLPAVISPVRVWRPGLDGVPAGGVVFGAVVR